MSVARLKPRPAKAERIPGDELNVIEALRATPELMGMVAFDEFAGEVRVTKPPPWDGMEYAQRWTDQSTTQLMAWLQARGYSISRRGVVEAAIAVVASDQKYHPVQKFLSGCSATWDGKKRIDFLWDLYFGAVGPDQYLQETSRKFLISAVARIFKPGCKVDTVPVLEAAQGAGKSSAVRLLGEPWVAESLPALSDDGAAHALQGAWFVELSELAAMTRPEIEHVKSFLSRQVDHYREPYARHFVDRPRQCVLIGTTNAATYLRDHTGNRRFWPIRCGQIELEALHRDRNQLLGEAVHAYEAGEAWHLTKEVDKQAAEIQERRRYVPELEVNLLSYLDSIRAQGHKELEMRAVIKAVSGVNSLDNPQQAGAIGSQCAAIMARHGWFAADVVGRGARRRNLWRFGEP